LKNCIDVIEKSTMAKLRTIPYDNKKLLAQIACGDKFIVSTNEKI